MKYYQLAFQLKASLAADAITERETYRQMGNLLASGEDRRTVRGTQSSAISVQMERLENE